MQRRPEQKLVLLKRKTRQSHVAYLVGIGRFSLRLEPSNTQAVNSFSIVFIAVDFLHNCS